MVLLWRGNKEKLCHPEYKITKTMLFKIKMEELSGGSSTIIMAMAIGADVPIGIGNK